MIIIIIILIFIILIFGMIKAYLVHISQIVVVFVLCYFKQLFFLSLENGKPHEFPLYAETLNRCYEQDIDFLFLSKLQSSIKG